MPTSPAQVAEIALWLEAYSQATQQLQQATSEAALAAWATFGSWYDRDAVARLARQVATLSEASQETTSGLASQYLLGAMAVMGAPTPTVRFPRLPPVRNGARLSLVHTRPAEAYKRAIATGATHQEALSRATRRAGDLTTSDLTLRDRDTMAAIMREAGVVGFRRVLRPELSRTGSCGLCIAAADRIYTTGELLPIHPPSCKCIPMPIIGDNDPGLNLNDEDLGQLYEDAGSTAAADLRRTRYMVNTHGEHGPVLTRLDDAFRGPDRVALADDPARAKRLLDQAAPVLEQMLTNGEPVPGALDYQRDFVARLAGFAAAA